MIVVVNGSAVGGRMTVSRTTSPGARVLTRACRSCAVRTSSSSTRTIRSPIWTPATPGSFGRIGCTWLLTPQWPPDPESHRLAALPRSGLDSSGSCAAMSRNLSPMIRRSTASIAWMRRAVTQQQPRPLRAPAGEVRRSHAPQRVVGGAAAVHRRVQRHGQARREVVGVARRDGLGEGLEHRVSERACAVPVDSRLFGDRVKHGADGRHERVASRRGA